MVSRSHCLTRKHSGMAVFSVGGDFFAFAFKPLGLNGGSYQVRSCPLGSRERSRLEI